MERILGYSSIYFTAEGYSGNQKLGVYWNVTRFLFWQLVGVNVLSVLQRYYDYFPELYIPFRSGRFINISAKATLCSCAISNMPLLCKISLNSTSTCQSQEHSIVWICVSKLVDMSEGLEAWQIKVHENVWIFMYVNIFKGLKECLTN